METVQCNDPEKQLAMTSPQAELLIDCHTNTRAVRQHQSVSEDVVLMIQELVSLASIAEGQGKNEAVGVFAVPFCDWPVVSLLFIFMRKDQKH